MDHFEITPGRHSLPYLPIVVQDTSRATLEALRAKPEAHETPHYVFSDGPRDQAQNKGPAGSATLKNVEWFFASVQLVFRNRMSGSLEILPRAFQRCLTVTIAW